MIFNAWTCFSIAAAIVGMAIGTVGTLDAQDEAEPTRSYDNSLDENAAAESGPMVISNLAWPQWRGPTRDGRVSGEQTPWPPRLAADNLKEMWRVDLGPGYSGPIVSHDLVFATETTDQKYETVRAFDRRTGKKRWETTWTGAMKVPFFARANGDWIRSTPAYDGESIFVAGMRDVLVCLNAVSGEEKWRVDFVAELGTSVPDFGFVCSPLATDSHVYVQAGASLLKLNKFNGKIVWRTLNDGGGMMGSAFSSPILADLAGRRQLVVQTRESLAGVDPQSGTVLWSQVIPAFRGMNILTPIAIEDSVFTSAYGGSSNLFGISNRNGSIAVEEKWANRAAGYMSTPVVIDGHLYLHLRNQRFTCINLENGESKWTTKPFGKYWSMIANRDRILALDERGDLLLIRANPEKFDLLGSIEVSHDPTWAHLAVSGEDLYIRELNALAAYRWTNEGVESKNGNQ